MEKDGARFLPSQSLIEGDPCFHDLSFETAHTNSNQVNLLGRQEHSGSIAYFYSFRPWISVIYHSYTLTGLSDLSFQRIYLVIQKRPSELHPSRRILGLWFILYIYRFTMGFLSTHPLFLDCNPSGADHSPGTFHLASSFPGLHTGSYSFGDSTSKTLQPKRFHLFYSFQGQNRPSFNIALL